MRGFQSVHDVRQRTDVVGIAEMNQLAIHKVGVARLGRHRDQHLCRIVVAQPSLAVIRLFLVKCQIDRLIRLLVPFVLDLMQILEPLACLGGRGSALYFIVFDFPSGLGVLILPLIELGQGVERQRGLALGCLENRSEESAEKPDVHEPRPVCMKQIH